MPDSKKSKVSKEQRAAAESLQKQIDDVVSRRRPAPRSGSLRDFVDRKMAEDKARKKAKKG